MKLGKLAKFKEIFLEGYPLSSLKEEHFDITSGYRLSAVVFNRPKGDSKKASAVIWLISNYGDISQEKLELEFAFSENERIEEIKKPKSFKIRSAAFQRKSARRIAPVDIVSSFEDVVIEDVKPSKGKEKIWYLDINIRVSGTQDKHAVRLEIDYANYEMLQSISTTNTIGLNPDASKKELKDVMFDDIRNVADFTINEDIVNGSPPSIPSKNIIIPSDNISIIKLDYIPPEDVDSKEAALKVEYFHKSMNRVISKMVQITFSQSIRQSARRVVANILPSEIRFIHKNRRTPPIEMYPEDFKYHGVIPGLRIIEVNYDYQHIEPNKRFVPAELIIEYKTLFFKYAKVMEFSFSKREYIDGTFRTIKNENNSIIIPKNFLLPSIIKSISDGDKQLKAKLIQSSKISKNYPYTKIKDIAISRFIPDSKLVIFAIKVNEKRGATSVIHSFEKHQILNKSFNEERLLSLQPEDIPINTWLLPVCPSVELTERIFRIPDWCIFEAMQYSKPEQNATSMSIKLRLKSGLDTVFIEKIVDFDLSINQFHKLEQDISDQNYLNNIDPSDIQILLDLDDEPVDQITSENIEGVPSGIGVRVYYRKPSSGERSSRIYVTLIKGHSQVTFEQTVIFRRPAQ